MLSCDALQPAAATLRVTTTRRAGRAARWRMAMRQNDRVLDEIEDQVAADRQTASLAGVAVTLLLLVVGLFLVHELHNKAMIEDCLLSGRSNCDAVLHNLP